MQRSTERILTTHTGSLPRPPLLVERMFAKEETGQADAGELDRLIGEAVREVVARQRQAGLDVIGDGEAGKPSYATYVKDRLEGFGGESHALQYADLTDFPELARRVFGDPGRARRKTPACTAPVRAHGTQAVEADIDHLRAAIGSGNGNAQEEPFLTAASPGVVSLFFRDQYYGDHEAYLFAIAEALRPEYQAVVQAGLVLQVDCPDLAMGRHIQFADLSLEAFQDQARLHVRALNHALEGLPPEQMRLHLCWGNYEGPHHRDVPLARVLDIALQARPQAISFEGANPRHEHEWELFETLRVPEGRVLIPGVIDSTTNYIEHPDLVKQRILRYARLVGRENVLAGCDCGFGTWVGQAAVDPEVVWAKMASLAEGARLASAELWR
ncbi:MAG TPA: cobalamin-independent methionine synthase II family protein [Chloroflexota bacterium]|nr:cobalamin-independent methionine synthase II family protein [Chloroflexota bacterium]